LKGVVTTNGKSQPIAWTLDGERVALEIDTRVYSIDAILKSAYKFTDRLYVFVVPSGDADARVIVTLSCKGSTTALSPNVGDFMNELVDQQLRIKLESEFGQVRSLIVAEAFAAGRVLDSGPNDDDYVRDPHGAGTRR